MRALYDYGARADELSFRAGTLSPFLVLSRLQPISSRFTSLSSNVEKGEARRSVLKGQ